MIDFRCATSGVVTCSDASESGAGVCASTTLGASGEELLLRRNQVWDSRDGLVLFECHAGIGGARRGCELAGVKVAGHFAVEDSEEAI